jgi:hypothetical protein
MTPAIPPKGWTYGQALEAVRGSRPEGATQWDPIEGWSYGGMSTSSPIDWVAGGLGGRAGARIAGTATQASLKRVATSTNLGQKLFGRHTGLLNDNPYIRLGLGWKGSKKFGQEIFRLSIGSRKGPVWLHWP